MKYIIGGRCERGIVEVVGLVVVVVVEVEVVDFGVGAMLVLVLGPMLESGREG